jgi:hypothetical protein
VFAAVGPRYQARDIDWFMNKLAKHLPKDARVRTHYRGDGGDWRLDVTLFRPDSVPTGSNDPHEFGVALTGADDGTASNRLWWYSFRQTCSNGMVIRNMNQASKRWMHVGNIECIEENIEIALGAAGKAVEQFGHLWQLAHHKHPIDAETNQPIDAAEALVRLALAKKITVTGASTEDTARALLAAWDLERDDSTAGVINAITRAAWEWRPSKWGETEQELEEQAGKLLYMKQLWVPAWTDETAEQAQEVM